MDNITWLRHNQIAAITLDDVLPSAIAAWIESIHQVSTDWAQEKPYLVLIDLSEIFLTSTIQQELINTANTPFSLGGRVAVVLAAGVVPHATRLMQTYAHKQKENHNTDSRFFTSQDKALAWLGELVQADTASLASG